MKERISRRSFTVSVMFLVMSKGWQSLENHRKNARLVLFYNFGLHGLSEFHEFHDLNSMQLTSPPCS